MNTQLYQQRKFRRNISNSFQLVALLLLIFVGQDSFAFTKVKWFPMNAQAFLQVGGGDSDAAILAKMMNTKSEAGYKNIDLFDSEFHLMCATSGKECSFVLSKNDFIDISQQDGRIRLVATGTAADEFKKAFFTASDKSLQYETENGRLQIFSDSQEFRIIYQE